VGGRHPAAEVLGQAFDVLKAKGAVYLRTDGRLAGCWVMPIQEDLDAPAEAEGPA
jgi:hypothetical protein